MLYLFWPVSMAYLRLATHPAIFERPLSRDEAMRNLDVLLSRPHVRAPGEEDGFWAVFRAVADPVAIRGS